MGHIEVPPPGASEIVGRLLSEALHEHPDVQWLGLMSEDGFAIASEGVSGVDEDAVAAGAVRMMVQVRSMAKALGQAGTEQMFLEGSESGICVIDKDPWVLVMVGSPGVPMGLLRYEAREIAESFPMGRQSQLTASPAQEQAAGADQPETDQPETDQPETDQRQWWSEDLGVATQPEPEIRWADEPTSDAPSGVPGADDSVTDFSEWAGFEAADGGAAFPAEPALPDFAGVDVAEPAADTVAVAPGFALDDDLAGRPVPDGAPITAGVLGVPYMSAGPDLFGGPQGAVASAAPEPFDLSDLAPPSGPALDLPAPTGAAFELPPPE
jgi:predicted regulator of Ras-like GTPase activity (Roadblock/LC7/MglB family)